MRIRDCKAIAAALGIAPTKVTDAVHDAACKLALLERLSDGRADRAEIGQRPASGAAGSAETAPPRRDTSRSRPMPTSPSCK